MHFATFREDVSMSLFHGVVSGIPASYSEGLDLLQALTYSFLKAFVTEWTG